MNLLSTILKATSIEVSSILLMLSLKPSDPVKHFTNPLTDTCRLCILSRVGRRREIVEMLFFFFANLCVSDVSMSL